MIWSAYLGLPLSLAGVGAVLKLEKQKLETGRDLIRYFCKPCAPTKRNGGRTRNLPGTIPASGNMFKSYNLRDVETEMEIQKKLARFPVPEFVWDEYHLDQEINDRGIRVDMQMVENAIRVDSCPAELTRRCRSYRSGEPQLCRTDEGMADTSTAWRSNPSARKKLLPCSRMLRPIWRGAGPPPAAGEKLRQEVPGHAELRLC